MTWAGAAKHDERHIAGGRQREQLDRARHVKRGAKKDEKIQEAPTCELN
jgi:hypothetical protein